MPWILEERGKNKWRVLYQDEFYSEEEYEYYGEPDLYDYGEEDAYGVVAVITLITGITDFDKLKERILYYKETHPLG